MIFKLHYILLVAFCIILIPISQALPEEETVPTPESSNAEVNDLSRANSTKYPTWTTWTRNDCTGEVSYTAFTSPQVDMSTAKTNCEQLGPNSELASIETQADFQFLRTKLPEMQTPIGFAFWLSGTDLNVHSIRGTGQYWYYSGLPIDVSFWGPDEPNDYNWQVQGIETCIDIKIPENNPPLRFLLNDELCSYPKGYLCKTTTKARKAAC